jgi:hypothetical protein
LLLVDADRQEPACADAVPLLSIATQATPHPPQPPEHLWSEHDRANDLKVQRWGVIAPAGPDGDALLASVAPLLAARAEQQAAPVREFRVPPQMSLAEAARWKRDVFLADGPRHELPRYQLILGDLHQVSEALQISQATDAFVGRLAFDDIADYAAYCAKLLTAERAPPPASRRAVFHTVHDGTLATVTGYRGLMRPCVEMARRRARDEPLRFPAEVIESGGSTPTRAELQSVIRESGVLMTMSHGVGAPRGGWRGPADQRARQGAISCGRHEGALCAADLAGAPCLPGGVWLMFSCFGAGTPATSKYTRWLAELAAQGALVGQPETITASLPSPGSPPFVAAIPRAVLADPRGPLAFIGHVDLAWSYSFCELDGERPRQQPWRFLDTMAAVLRGDRVGVAFRELFRYFDQVTCELAALDEEPTPQPLRRAHLWMLRQDLAGFMLLGDPAARLERPPQPRRTAIADLLGLPSAGPRVDVDANLVGIERAICQVIVGAWAIDRAARECTMETAAFASLVDLYRRAGMAAIRKS